MNQTPLQGSLEPDGMALNIQKPTNQKVAEIFT